MNKTLIILLVLLVCKSTNTSAQHWRYPTDTIKYVESNAEGAMAYFNRYDTVPIKYKDLAGEVHNGYKYVYKKNGYYIDDPEKTINVFFNIRRRRVNDVHSYYFVSSFD